MKFKGSDEVSSTTTPDPVTREEVHLRRIDMRAFRRSDGLYEAEARLTDRKPHDFPIPDSRTVPANEAIHDMGVSLTFDEDMTVREVRTFSKSFPFTECPAGGVALQTLVGLRIATGWGREVRSLLRGAASFTHLTELLIPLGTTAVKALTMANRCKPEPIDQSGRPLKIDSCYAYRAGGEVVVRRWPQFNEPGTQAKG